jgi:hypothetical protein
MRLFRRRETLNQRPLREADVGSQRRQTPVKPNRDSAPDEPSSYPDATGAVSDVLGDVGVGVLGQGEDPWDAFCDRESARTRLR